MTINLIQPAVPEQKIPTVWQRSSRFITCLFCELRGRQVGQSLLCSNCLADPVQTRIAVHFQLDNWLAQQVAALDEWESFRDAHADKWQQVEQARATDPAFDAKADAHRKAGNVYGRLLDAEAQYAQAVERLADERARLERVLEEIEQDNNAVLHRTSPAE